MKFKHIVAASVAALAAFAAFAERDTAIYRGKLTSDMNANQHSITNLPDGFFPEETDPTVADWARKGNPPPTTEEKDPHFKEFQANGGNVTNGVTVVDGQTAHLRADTAPAGLKITEKGISGEWRYVRVEGSQSWVWTNDPFFYAWSDFITEETDPTVPSWAKSAQNPSYTKSETYKKSEVDSLVAQAGKVKKVANVGPDTNGNVPLTPGSIGAATSEEVENVKVIVQTWEGFLDGSNVVFSITNYISGTYSLDHSKMEIRELRDGVYHTVYESRTEITNHTEAVKREMFGVINSKELALRAEIATKGDVAWGRRSSTGQDVPMSNTVWITEPNLRIAGGMEYERVAVGEGAIYVLASKGATPYMVGDEGSLMLKDDGGTNYFGMVRSDSYTIGCNTDGIRTDPANHLVYLDFLVTMNDHPVVWYMPTLENYNPDNWEQLNLPDGSPVPGASHQVYWDDTPRLGAQECYINVGNAPQGFFRATIEVAGDVRFKTNMSAEIPSLWCTDDPTKKVKVIWNNGNPKFVEAQ